MIVSFSVSNFRSFAAEETLSLVASKRFVDSHTSHAVPIPDSKERVLRAAVLYGANGAGKSNLFRALGFVRSVALFPREKGSGTNRSAFRFADSEDGASTFDLQFITKDKLYRFGFKVDDRQVTEEWLVQVIGPRERILYERTSDRDGKVTVDAPELKKNAGEKLKALITVGGPSNQSFLATVHATLNTSDYGEELGSILQWFDDGLNLITPDAPYVGLAAEIADNAEFRDFASEFLKRSSTGIEALQATKTEITADNLQMVLPDKSAAEVLKTAGSSHNAPEMLITRLKDGTEVLFQRKDGGHFYRMTIQAAHEHKAGELVSLELSDESDGTRRLLNLIPALHRMRSTSEVYVVDEIDRSLHPILVIEFLRFFLNTCHSGQCQIIVTTHESNLLDLELLRRDEIWFAEKDLQGATRLYSLADFKVRKDLEVRKHYLQGRFGAVPFLGSLEQLEDKEDCRE